MERQKTGLVESIARKDFETKLEKKIDSQIDFLLIYRFSTPCVNYHRQVASHI